MGVRERNHVVPKMLSKQWTNSSGKFWWYDKSKPNHGIQCVTPNGAFWKRRLYVQESIEINTAGRTNFRRNDSVEIHLGENVEGPAEPILSHIVQQVRNGVEPELSVSERQVLERFFFCQYTRSPNSRDSILPLEEAQAASEQLASMLASKRGYPITEDEQRLLVPETVKRIYANAFASFVGAQDEASLTVLKRCGLFFLSARPGSLVIGSDPIAEFPTNDGKELGVGDAVAMLPVAPDVAVAFGPPDCDGRVTNIRDADLSTANQCIVAQSDSFAATSSSLVASFVQNSAGSSSVLPASDRKQ